MQTTRAVPIHTDSKESVCPDCPLRGECARLKRAVALMDAVLARRANRHGKVCRDVLQQRLELADFAFPTAARPCLFRSHPKLVSDTTDEALAVVDFLRAAP